ncbi:hypothetical protein KAT80_02685 [Candidatus Pacearchaeota archaeon]|nr:hypothetical protein [Candidatus Pacearchaeota archaeon]
MTFYLSLIGKEIICECVKHIPIDNPSKSTMILDRPIKVNFKHKSKRRTGKPCYAYVNSEVKYKSGSSEDYYIVKDMDIDEIKEKLKIRFSQDYKILFTGEIYGKKLIGECSKIKDFKISHMSAVHGGQRVHLSCNIFSICYVEHPHEMANLKFSAK